MVMLGNHPHLAVPEVTWYYPRFRAYLQTYGDLGDEKNFRTLVSEMIFGLKTPLLGLPLNPATIVDQLIRRTKAPTFAEAFRAILETFAEAQNRPRWGEKTPHNLFYVREILQDFPEAKIINVTRDGRDVAVEQLRSAFGPRNVYSAAKIWQRVEKTAADLRATLPATTWLDVRYEDLVTNPQNVLTKVTDFIGERFDLALLKFYEAPIAQRRGTTRDHRPLGRPVTAEYVGIYNHFLSAYDQSVYATVAGEELRRAGYGDVADKAVFNAEKAALWDEHDQRIRAATLDAPEGHVVYESYNDWLIEQREARRRAGIWTPQRNAAVFDWTAEFISGQRAPSQWKNYFNIKRRYTTEGLVL